jgi:hypothetical protein
MSGAFRQQALNYPFSQQSASLVLFFNNLNPHPRVNVAPFWYHGSLATHGRAQFLIPQVLPVVQEAVELLENELPPEILEAKVEIFFFTSWLPQAGQATSPAPPVLRTSSSNGWLHWLHTNSNIGIVGLSKKCSAE